MGKDTIDSCRRDMSKFIDEFMPGIEISRYQKELIKKYKKGPTPEDIDP